MYLILVLLLWASLVAGALYRYRKVVPIADFLHGFYLIWWAVVNAAKPKDPDDASDAFDYGIIAGVISVISVFFGLIILFAVSIWWAI